MKALVPANGTVEFAEVPQPEPRPGEVLVKVDAFSVNRGETFLLEDPPPGWRPGKDVAGLVVQAAADGTGPAVGQRVVAHPPGAGWAEYAAVRTDALAVLPERLAAPAAAALPLAGLTALQALVDHAAVQPGETVLVHGGAGGVGLLAVQLAVLLGAQVTATVRSDTTDLLRGCGAQRVIDTRTGAFDETGAAYDVVVDTVGGQTLDRSFGVLRRGGRLITLSAPPPDGRADEFGVSATFFIVRPNRDQLTELAALVDGDRLRVAIAQTFPLGEGREAYESRERGGRAGKTVLVVRD